MSRKRCKTMRIVIVQSSLYLAFISSSINALCWLSISCHFPSLSLSLSRSIYLSLSIFLSLSLSLSISRGPPIFRKEIFHIKNTFEIKGKRWWIPCFPFLAGGERKMFRLLTSSLQLLFLSLFFNFYSLLLYFFFVISFFLCCFVVTLAFCLQLFLFRIF